MIVREKRNPAVAALAILLPLCAVLAPAQPPRQTGDGIVALSLPGAVAAGLKQSPLLEFTRAQVADAQGKQQQAAGVFDPLFSAKASESRTDSPLTSYQEQIDGLSATGTHFERSTTEELTVDETRQLRNGIEFAASLSMQRVLDNISGIQGSTASNLSVSATVPILRGRGASVVDAEEMAARIESDATREDDRQQALQVAGNVASAYWTLAAQQQLLQIGQAAEQRARSYLDSVRELVKADDAPSGDLNQVQANLASQSAQRIAAENNLIAAQAALALQMGIAPEGIAILNLSASQSLGSSDVAAVPDLALCLDVAHRSRPDFLAATRRVQEAETLVAPAKNALKPRLDFGLSAGYRGLRQGRTLEDWAASLGNQVGHPEIAASLNFSSPAGQDAARGQLAQSLALLAQARSQLRQIDQSIVSQVVVAHAALEHSRGQAREAANAVRDSRLALDGEREKYKAGISAIVDVVTVEERLNAAENADVAARLAVEQARIQLSLAEGELVVPSPAGFAPNPQVFGAGP